jgi:hypothetical protein
LKERRVAIQHGWCQRSKVTEPGSGGDADRDESVSVAGDLSPEVSRYVGAAL